MCENFEKELAAVGGLINLFFSRRLCPSSNCLISVPEMGNLNGECGGFRLH